MDAIQKIIDEGRPVEPICISDSREARYKVRTWYKIGVHDGYDYAIKETRKRMSDKACKIYCDDLCESSRCGMCYHKYDHKAQVKNDFKYSECETLKMFRKDMEE